MYSISNVIVGVPITPKLCKLIDKWEQEGDERWKEWEDLGFETFYHGGGDRAFGYCGVHIGEFDECAEWIEVSWDGTLYVTSHAGEKTIPLYPTSEQLSEALKKVEALDPELRTLCPELGVYIVQSTS